VVAEQVLARVDGAGVQVVTLGRGLAAAGQRGEDAACQRIAFVRSARVSVVTVQGGSPGAQAFDAVVAYCAWVSVIARHVRGQVGAGPCIRVADVDGAGVQVFTRDSKAGANSFDAFVQLGALIAVVARCAVGFQILHAPTCFRVAVVEGARGGLVAQERRGFHALAASHFVNYAIELTAGFIAGASAVGILGAVADVQVCGSVDPNIWWGAAVVIGGSDVVSGVRPVCGNVRVGHARSIGLFSSIAVGAPPR